MLFNDSLQASRAKLRILITVNVDPISYHNVHVRTFMFANLLIPTRVYNILVIPNVKIRINRYTVLTIKNLSTALCYSVLNHGVQP